MEVKQQAAFISVGTQFILTDSEPREEDSKSRQQLRFSPSG